MATALDVAEAEYPANFSGNAIAPLEGKSLIPVFGDSPVVRSAIYWEHEGNRAVRRGKWKLVAENRGPWELYDMEADRTETNDLMPLYPELGREMIEMYTEWEKKCGVLPSRPERKPGFVPPPLKYPEPADYEPLPATP